MIRLFVVNISMLLDEAGFKKAYLRSSKERREKADKLRQPEDKARCIAAGLLLAYAYEKFREEYIKELARANSFGYAAEQEKRIPEKLPEIREREGGKPELVFADGAEGGIYFNLSHSGAYVICVVADFEVGADIQRRTNIRESLIRRFFSEEENMRMNECGEDEILKERMFAKIWTVKEARAKLTGRGIAEILENGDRDGATECHIWQGELDMDYAWAVACYKEDISKDSFGISGPVAADEGEVFYG